jgi:hypothetical protein
MDTLTIECFSSKKTYNKYLAKKDPTMFQKNETFHIELIQNHDAIMGLLSEYILNPDSISQSKMRDSFNQLMIECLDVLGTTKTETRLQPQNEEPDIMFSQCEDLGKQPNNPIEYWKMQNVFKN